MIQQVELVLLPEEVADEAIMLQQAADRLFVPSARIFCIRIIRRSIDSRGSKTLYRIKVNAYIDENPPPVPSFSSRFNFQKDVSRAPEVLIAGFGPAGMFASLKLIENGYKPVVIERGKNVRERRRDLARLNRKGMINEDSNYCYGEGGAGTFSDGKLYTRSNKRGSIERILQILVMHGADEMILVDAHPHIGTNKLPALVTEIRNTILHAGGEIHFNTRMTDLLISQNRVTGIRTEDTLSGQSSEFLASSVILATGHSARDIYSLLHRKGIHIEAKPFALGVRAEHPQQVIDQQQYHSRIRHPNVPPASYSLACQAAGRSLYSFCMCPGGIIAPAATSSHEVVVNGWSPSRRNNPFANSGLVVNIGPEDFRNYSAAGPLAGMYFQQEIEQKSFEAGGGGLRAPAQRMVDFTRKRISSSLPSCSYIPGIIPADLYAVLPDIISQTLCEGLKFFGKKMPSYFTNEAILVATESRTSSPVRIPRNSVTMQHPQIRGLFPCAEGAGYAGGIVSAAMDGENCGEAVLAFMKNQQV